MRNQQLLNTSANAPHDLLVVVDVAGNGKSILQATNVEVRDGRLIISCETPGAKKTKPETAPTSTTAPAPTTAPTTPATVAAATSAAPAVATTSTGGEPAGSPETATAAPTGETSPTTVE